jgi:hypothetical protein
MVTSNEDRTAWDGQKIKLPAFPKLKWELPQVLFLTQRCSPLAI